jgi:thymidylate synthase (FAD)
MQIIRPHANLQGILTLTQGEVLMSLIEDAARISHRSEDNKTAESWPRFIQNVVIDHGDWSVVEHITLTVDFMVDRGITHELVRHRLFSFTQESTRFVNYEKKMPPSFIYPFPDVSCDYCSYGNPALHFPDGWFHSPDDPGPQIKCTYERYWLDFIANCEDTYKKLIKDKKWSPQMARSVLPNALASKIRMTGNLRNWRHFFLMRTTAETHPQMKQVTIPLLEVFKNRIPMIFNDVEPGSRQIDNLKKSR